MMKKCPACKTIVPGGDDSLCPRCGKELKSYFSGMSEEERALYVRKLARAMKDGAVRGAHMEPPAEVRRVQQSEAGRASLAKSSRQAYSESTPVPVLERDRFEYPEEFKARIEGYPPVVAGSVLLVKEHYDLQAGIFPVKVQWNDWVKPLLKELLASSASIHADRDLARSIYQAGSTHPVFVRLKVEGEEPAVAGAELWLPGKVIPLEMRLQDLTSAFSHQVWEEPVTGMVLMPVEGGCYQMGCGDWDGKGYPHEKPVHEVCLDSFWMGKYPVTQGEWKKVMGANPSYFKLGDRYPVECVSWLDVKQFIRKLTSLNEGLYTFRLPTEAEWEYACRSEGKLEKYAGGVAEKDLDDVAWHARNSGSSPHEVGAKRPNGLDLYDMSGNVWEWCEDIYSDTAYERHERTNPACCTGEPDRVIRGGSWHGNPNGVRCSSRGFLDQTYRRHFVGFRLVRAR